MTRSTGWPPLRTAKREPDPTSRDTVNASGGGAPALGWAHERRAQAVGGRGGGLISPSPSTRASRADLAHGIKVVRPVGRSTLTP